MAEFQEVMRQAARLCNYMDNKCTYCPLTTEAFCQSCANEMENFPGVEKVIMSWAAKYPEPVYPTWVEWLAEMGLVCWEDNGDGDGVYSVMAPTFKLCTPIPADIAEKLGLQPKQ